MKHHGPALSARRWGRSARAAGAGLRHTWVHEPNFRLQLGAAALAAALAGWLRAPLVPILLVSALVLALELVNTAVEALTDLASPQQHPLARTAKDAAAGAVLLASGFAVLVGLAVLGPPLWARMGTLGP